MPTGYFHSMQFPEYCLKEGSRMKARRTQGVTESKIRSFVLLICVKNFVRSYCSTSISSKREPFPLKTHCLHNCFPKKDERMIIHKSNKFMSIHLYFCLAYSQLYFLSNCNDKSNCYFLQNTSKARCG
jgi:hypothetical protein